MGRGLKSLTWLQIMLAVWSCVFSAMAECGYDQSYDYDALNRMTTAYSGQEGVDANAYGVASYGYDAVGNMTGSGYANGVGHQYNYSALNRLKELTVGKMSSGVDPPSISTIHQKYTYTLNNAGHRTQITEHSGRTINHVFDKLYRLKSETITGDTNAQNGTVSYTHDKVGNRLSRTSSVSSVPSVVQTYTANDHLTGDTVDSNGNTIASPIAHLADHTGTYTDVYDFRNKLIKRSYTGGKVILTSYDADGNRVSKEVLDGSLGIREHHYLVDTNNHTGYAQVVEEKDGAGVLTRVNLFGHDLVSTLFNSEGYQRYYQYDGLGSVRALSDENGDVTDEYTYDAFGLLLSSSGSTPNQYRYTGEQWDSDLGMYFLRARYMNVATGRFHSMDTYEGRNREPMTLHKYLYAHANPVSGTDPSGNQTLVQTSQALGITLNFTLNITRAEGLALAYVASSVARRWQIHFAVEEGGNHAYIYTKHIFSGEQYRYDIGLNRGKRDLRESIRRPFTFYDGFIRKNPGSPDAADSVTKVGLLGPIGYKMWEGTMFAENGISATVQFDHSYNIIWSSCYGWSVRAAAYASILSLLPIL